MDKKETAINDFLKFKNDTLLSRDKAIEIYNFFKLNPEVAEHQFAIGLETLNVKNEYFWHIINTGIIKKLYQTNKSSTVKNSSKDIDETFEANLTKLRKEALSYKQKLNFERNNFNKKLKEIISLEDLNKELIQAIKQIPLKPVEYRIEPTKQNGKTGIICISDTHFNELIHTPTNKYDFEIASKRLKKLAQTAILHFTNNGITQVAVLFLGDLLNSDRRQNEYMNMVTNRSKAMVLAFYLLRQFVEELSIYFNLTIASVTGNESRVVGEEYDTSEEIATYNYDYTIHQFLKVAFEYHPNVKFIDGNFSEKIINISGQNVLITHGVALKTDLEKSVTQTFGRYGTNGVNVDYLFCGHLHSARIGDTCARCGSLCGSNSYSEGALNLNSRASQLIGIFYTNKTRNIMNVDLQNTDEIEGYKIIKELEEYNAKSINKKQKFLIHEI